MAVLLGAEKDGVVVRAKTADLDLRQVGERRADGRIILACDLELGREVVAPVAEQLSDVGLIGLRQRVPGRAQRNTVGIDQREPQHALLEVVVTQCRAVVFVDVPVDLERIFLGFGLAGVRQRQRPCIEAVGTTRDVLDLRNVRIGDFAATIRRRRQAGTRRSARILLVVGEEEQPILEQRTAEGHAVGFFVLEAVELDAAQFLAHPVLVAERVIRGAVEFIGTRLRHRVDDRAGAAGDRGVVIGQIDVDRLDGVDRDRLALGRQVVGLQAEWIGSADAVDADRVVARVLAAGGNRAVGLADLRDARIQPDVVLDVAIGRRKALDGLERDVRACAHLVGTEDLRTASGDRLHRAERRHFVVERGVDRVDLVQGQIDVLFGIGPRAGLVDRDAVRTADTEAARVVAAAGIRDSPADRARLGVQDGDFRARHRLPIGTRNDTADTGGGALRKNRRRGERNEKA